MNLPRATAPSRLMTYHARAEAAPAALAPSPAAVAPLAAEWPALHNGVTTLWTRLSNWLRGLLEAAPSRPGGAGALSAEQLRRGAFAGCLFGATVQKGHATAETTAAQLGRQLDVNHSFYRWDDQVPSAEDRADVAAGRVPFISWNAITRRGQDVRWAEIASGAHDARLVEVARGIRSLGKPVIFTFNHEPENDTTRGTPAEYRAAWQRVSDILMREGATNAVKTFVAMGGRSESYDAFYPGNAVDWIGADVYNWAYSANNPTAKWRSFEEAATPFYTWARTKGKPLLIGEVGCVEDPSQPGRKAQWLRDMGETLKKWPEVKSVNYFNNKHDGGRGVTNWTVETPQAVAAFRAVAQDAYFARH